MVNHIAENTGAVVRNFFMVQNRWLAMAGFVCEP